MITFSGHGIKVNGESIAIIPELVKDKSDEKDEIKMIS